MLGTAAAAGARAKVARLPLKRPVHTPRRTVEDAAVEEAVEEAAAEAAAAVEAEGGAAEAVVEVGQTSPRLSSVNDRLSTCAAHAEYTTTKAG